MTPTQSPTMASQATAELPKLPPSCAHVWTWRAEHPGKYDAFLDNANEPYFTADQMNAHYLAGVEAGRASRAQSEWISVEDRLPDVSGIEDGETVLVANRGGCFAAEWHGTGITGFSSIHGDQFVQVTHWQPLPATLGETK